MLRYPLVVSIASETPFLGTPPSALVRKKGSWLRSYRDQTGVTLTQVDTLYNAFESFEQDEECHVSKVMMTFPLVWPTGH
jgi:hypothetical protein